MPWLCEVSVSVPCTWVLLGSRKVGVAPALWHKLCCSTINPAQGLLKGPYPSYYSQVDLLLPKESINSLLLLVVDLLLATLQSWRRTKRIVCREPQECSIMCAFPTYQELVRSLNFECNVTVAVSLADTNAQCCIPCLPTGV